MRLPLKLICPASKVRSDGTSIVFIQYCYSATKRVLLNTEMAIPPDSWQKKQCCISDKLPPAFGNHSELNEELTRQLRIAEDLVTHAKRNQISNKGAFVKKTFSPNLDITTAVGQIAQTLQQELTQEQAKLDIYYQLDEYIKSKQRKVSKATLTVYGIVKSQLLAFEKYRKEKITFQSFDFSFYEDFVDYLTFDHVHIRRQTVITGLKVNSIGKTTKHLRGFIKDRVKRKIMTPIDLTDFKIPEEESDAIYLTYEEIAQI